MKTVVVYGPQGCGKTTHAYELMKRHGCTILHDDEWDGVTPLQPGALVLTNQPPPYQFEVDEVWSLEACHKGCACSSGKERARRTRIPFTTQFVNLDCLSNHLNLQPGTRSGHKFPGRRSLLRRFQIRLGQISRRYQACQ